MQNRRWLGRTFPVLALTLGIALLLVACRSPESQAQRHSFFALGTLVEISVYSPPKDIAAILRETEDLLLEEENRWRAFGQGELAHINRELAAGHPVAFSEPLRDGIQRAGEIATRSGYRFNPAIGELVRLWGFHEESRAEVPPPDASSIAALLPAPRLDALHLHDDGLWRSEDEHLWLDMGAFAKGLAVDRAVSLLRKRGVRNAIVNAGGDLKVIGRHGDRAWRIGVRNPRASGILAAIEVGDQESVFTSGDYERQFEWHGKRYHHILDPATGQPARGIVSVTVIHRDAALADAAATALFVAGPDAWRKVAADLGVDKAMIVRDDGEIRMTENMQPRVTFEKASVNAQVEAVSP